ncbi:conjugal transfer protein TraD [Labrenzia sp. DG1229]|uniref:conjugal transfer protein TraD n=1 Tax=Labrenzia sp. DG1229 TaxID=681847 RepID=UPI00048AFEB5|nr:conjugal transfer protein TraD [Labrenzia sp. DG1229]
MQRIKHSKRRKETRKRLELGDAVIAAGAGDLAHSKIVEVLSAHVVGTTKTVPEQKHHSNDDNTEVGTAEHAP